MWSCKICCLGLSRGFSYSLPTSCLIHCTNYTTNSRCFWLVKWTIISLLLYLKDTKQCADTQDRYNYDPLHSWYNKRKKWYSQLRAASTLGMIASIYHCFLNTTCFGCSMDYITIKLNSILPSRVQITTKEQRNRKELVHIARTAYFVAKNCLLRLVGSAAISCLFYNMPKLPSLLAAPQLKVDNSGMLRVFNKTSKPTSRLMHI